MSTAENKAVIRRYFTLLDEHRLEDVADLFAPDYHLHFDGNPVMDRETAIGLLGAFLAAFPDIHHEIKEQLAEGDRVVTRIVASGTQRYELMGIPASENRMVIDAINFARLKDGKMAELWVTSDSLRMMQQLGVIPAPQQAGV